MKKRFAMLALWLVGFCVTAFSATTPLTAAAEPLPTTKVLPLPPAPFDNIPVDLIVNGIATTGTLTINRFVTSGGQIFAVATLTAGTVSGLVRVPVDLINAQASCEVLHLELGPLDLNLLGLQVHLDRVVLDITAVPGPGNLVGNLLCLVAGLLDLPTLGIVLLAITTVLNVLLGVL